MSRHSSPSTSPTPQALALVTKRCTPASSDRIFKTHTVEGILGARSYRVLIGSRLLDLLPDLLKNESLPSPCAIVTDSNVAPLYAGKLQHQLASSGFKPVVITVPAGEKSKSLPQVGDVCDQMIAAGLDRRSS